jgi:hypothetical protein
MFSSVLPTSAVPRAKPFTGFLTLAMQSQQATCIAMQRSAGVLRLWLQLMTHGMSRLLDRLWQIEKVLMGQLPPSLNM